MKYLVSAYIIVILFGACSSTGSGRKLAGFANLLHGEKTIIISCIRCNCVIGELNKIISESPQLLNGYFFAGDPACTEGFIWHSKMIPYSQKQLDSISTDFYNLLIVKKSQNGRPSVQLIKTEDALNMKKYL